MTAKVLHDVHVPVWTMAHTEEAPNHSDLDMRRIVCAVDATPASVELMRWAAGLCKKLGATLRLVHAVPGIDAWPEQPLDHEFQETLRENARRNIQELEKAADIDVPVCVGVGSVADVVREEALQHGADLVLIGRGALQETMGRLRTAPRRPHHFFLCPLLSTHCLPSPGICPPERKTRYGRRLPRESGGPPVSLMDTFARLPQWRCRHKQQSMSFIHVLVVHRHSDIRAYIVSVLRDHVRLVNALFPHCPHGIDDFTVAET